MSDVSVYWGILLNPRTGRPAASKSSRHAFSAAFPHEGARPICGAFASGLVRNESAPTLHPECARCRMVVRMKGYDDLG
jgi:hypothetical protein